MLKVLMRLTMPAVSAATVEESMPPERKTPSGTSATSRRLTAWASSRRSSAQRSSSDALGAGPGRGMSQ
ncbi:hypothetical protein DSECCO2_549880 [anaerobic digester metagenome]